MPKITIVTPSNSPKWIAQARDSVFKQTFTDWEWLIIANSCELSAMQQLATDPRVHVIPYTGDKNADGGYNVGALKAFGCKHASGEYIVELDHDDELAINCLKEVANAFETTQAVFVYSDAVRVKPDGLFECYGPDWGWSSRDDVYLEDFGKEVHVQVVNSPIELPQNISRIWYAPDHVRAWRTSAYNSIGGHDMNMKVCDDLDLMCRLYKIGTFHHIHKVLYKYQIHTENTWQKNLELIQGLTWANHDKYIEELSQIYCKRNNLIAADLGGGIDSPAGWTSVDQQNADVIANLDEKWPFEDGSVGAFRAHDVIEHLKNPIHVMNEAYRCLRHGGLFLIEVPSTDGRGAFQDPTHISFWNTNSFWYYTRNTQNRYIKHAGANCRFQVARVVNYFPSQWHQDHNIIYAKVHLAAIKDGPRLHGEYHI